MDGEEGDGVQAGKQEYQWRGMVARYLGGGSVLQEIHEGFRQITYPSKKDIRDETKRDGTGYRND